MARFRPKAVVEQEKIEKQESAERQLLDELREEYLQRKFAARKAQGLPVPKEYEGD
jgi:molybdopterin converting factor small subunit